MSRGDSHWSGSVGGLFGALGVGLSAYAAHVAAGTARQWLYTAAAMALVHGLLLATFQPRTARIGALARIAVALGVVLFSGSLLGAQLFGWPTRLAPTGGGLLIAGWLLVALDRARG